MYQTLIILLLVFYSANASAQELLGSEGDWKIYSITKDGAKICYLASAPTSTKGTFKKRGEPYFLVTQKTKEQLEASASSGFPFKADTDVHVKLGSKTRFRFFTQENLAWAKDSKQDSAVIEAMQKSSSMTVRGTSKRGTFAEDTYSLKGFSVALEKMKASCP